MAEKLAGSTWAAFVRMNKLDLDDVGVRKALAGFDRADDSGPAARMAALQNVADQLKKQLASLARKKKDLGDKPFSLASGKVRELLELAERELRDARKERSQPEDDEEADSSELLTTRMIPLLREVRRGKSMHVLLGTSGKDTGVLLSRRPIAPHRRKLIVEHVGGGTLKFFPGECIFENDAHTFVMRTQAAGLAKKIKAALLRQVALRVKVRVRGEDPGDIDDDGDVAADAEALADDAAPAAAGPSVSPPAAPDGAVAAFTARLAALMPAVKAALSGAGPAAAGIRLKVGEAGVLARQQDLEAAHRLLDEAEALMGRSAATATTATADADDARLQARAAYESLLERLRPDYLAATADGAAAALVDQIATVSRAWGMAGDSARAGDTARALLILQRLADGGVLAKLLAARKASAATTPAGRPAHGIAGQRAFMRTRWARIPVEFKAELASLAGILADQGADDDPQGLADAIDAHLRDLLDGIQERMDQAIQSGDASGFQGLRQRVEDDDLMGHLRKAPFMDGSRFQRAVLDAMDEIEAGLTA